MYSIVKLLAVMVAIFDKNCQVNVHHALLIYLPHMLSSGNKKQKLKTPNKRVSNTSNLFFNF